MINLIPETQTRIEQNTHYMGIQTWKQPLDAWVYQEIIHEQKPDTIIEIGNHHGGTLLYLAHLCDNIGKGKVVGIDLDHSPIDQQVLEHRRIDLFECDAGRENPISDYSLGGVLIIEDSDHTHANTLRILKRWSPLIRRGGYFIVEDAILCGGVVSALEAFTEKYPEFVPDRTREWPLTWNPGGYLQRVA